MPGTRGGTERRSRKELRDLIGQLEVANFRLHCVVEAMRQDVRTADARLRHAARQRRAMDDATNRPPPTLLDLLARHEADGAADAPDLRPVVRAGR